MKFIVAVLSLVPQLMADGALSLNLIKDGTVKELEKFSSFLSIPYLLLAFALLTLLLLYFFMRYRQELNRLRSITEENAAINSNNAVLNFENKEYKESLQKQKEFITGMGNKLKDPASEILGKTQKVLNTELSDKQSIELRNIQGSGQVLFSIVDDLLDFMKIRSHELQIKEEPFDINDLLDMVVNSVLERIEKKDVEVVFDIDKSVPPRLVGDSIRIGQVLTNLLENGIKFTQSGEVRLHVKPLSKAEDSLQLMFEVVDTGIGIPESKLDDIFSPFYQINNNNSAGLGLSISKALIEMMGGEILVSTELNKGSTFTFVLKLKPFDIREQRQYRLPAKSYKRRHILIVDYQDNASYAMKKQLEYFHNDVDIIPQAELESTAPDLSRYDMLFIAEKLFNFNLVKQVNALKEKKEIKLVVVGSMLRKPVNSNIIGKLADQRLMKPINQLKIFDLLVALYGDDEEIVAPDESEVSMNTSMPRIVIERTQKQDVRKEDFEVFSGANILVVEDNLINQKVMGNMLKDSGICVDMAGDGEVAYAMAHEKKYDLILMDIHMPNMDGYEATTRLRRSKKTANVPIVALTGNILPDEIAQMQACGMDDRLEKPVRAQSIYSLFNKYLESQPLSPENDESYMPDRIYQFEEGLVRAGGDLELYKELVNEFLRLYKNSDVMLDSYFEQKDNDAFKALCLDIKGVSANIGIYSLANAAKRMRGSSLSSTSMPKLLQNYKSTLSATLVALETKSKSW